LSRPNCSPQLPGRKRRNGLENIVKGTERGFYPPVISHSYGKSPLGGDSIRQDVFTKIWDFTNNGTPAMAMAKKTSDGFF